MKIKKFNEIKEYTVNLEDLVGEHILSGVDITIEEESNDYSSEDINVVKFILDGKTYKAKEDPSDGYRSYCEEIVVCGDKVLNTFPEHVVIGAMMGGGDYGEENKIIQFFDYVTKDCVLEIGTGNYNDYYPYCGIQRILN